jgi:hypothetical protein
VRNLEVELSWNGKALGQLQPHSMRRDVPAETLDGRITPIEDDPGAQQGFSGVPIGGLRALRGMGHLLGLAAEPIMSPSCQSNVTSPTLGTGQLCNTGTDLS